MPDKPKATLADLKARADSTKIIKGVPFTFTDDGNPLYLLEAMADRTNENVKACILHHVRADGLDGDSYDELGAGVKLGLLAGVVEHLEMDEDFFGGRAASLTTPDAPR